MKQGVLYSENQYLGRDRVWISVRLVLVLFCFTAFYLNLDHLISSQLFFIVGVGIIITSIVMMYMVLFRTEVFQDHVLISGLWSTRSSKLILPLLLRLKRHLIVPSFSIIQFTICTQKERSNSLLVVKMLFF